MRRSLLGLVILLATASVDAKVLCPPGRFVLHASDHPLALALDGRDLELGAGSVTIGGLCEAVSARRFDPTVAGGRWLRVRARWRPCSDGHARAIRARFDSREAIYCTRLAGVLRLGGGRRVPFTADRVPECGNGLRETGEQCDGPDGAAGTCCNGACGVEPGCPVACDDLFPCAPDQLCAHYCGTGGVCELRSEADCGDGPVCDCSEDVTYPDRCAAWEAGAGVGHPGPCHR